MKNIIIPLILLLSVISFSFSQNATSPEAVEYAKQGMRLFDQGSYGEAIVQYKKGRALAPNNSLFSYEIALSYFSMKNYPSCIVTLDSVIQRTDINSQFFQLMGDAYDMSGKPDSAMAVFKTGMLRFPKAADLSMECGVLEYAKKNYKVAHTYWLDGLAKDPSYADNYYHLARFYSDSANRIPALLYSEIYLNLTRNTAQVAEINKLFCTLLGKSIHLSPDSTVILKFSANSSGKFLVPDSVKDFCQALSHTFQKAGLSLKDKKLKAGIDAVSAVREAFIKTWFEQKYNLRFRFSLFDFEKQVLDAGHYYSYNQWLMIKCNMFEFQRWFEDNKKNYTDFVEWYKNHPFKNLYPQDIFICR
ncbi:MAG TPA: hypothetical protein PK269_11320 [Bacteroidales bacterium]|nr:hypothetical protein [Bacteroidales bacterium]